LATAHFLWGIAVAFLEQDKEGAADTSEAHFEKWKRAQEISESFSFMYHDIVMKCLIFVMTSVP
jgi:cobalamin-dependent methionine synthase I